MIADLRNLWIEAFADTQETIDAFFTVAFSDTRAECILENGVPVSALYWFDCQCYDRKLAYIYAVATAKAYRGKGLAHRLLEETHGILQKQGYSGGILVPSKPELFDFYRQFGYETTTTVARISCEQGVSSVPLREITPAEYTRLRRVHLPEGGVVQEGQCVPFLQGYCKFYAGEDFLLICEVLPEELRAQELLGNAQAAPGILRALNCPKGCFRTPGKDSDFAMCLPFRADCPEPNWFGLALD